MTINKVYQWYFGTDTTQENKNKYLGFMVIAFFAVLASFSPMTVGVGIGAAIYLATFLVDLWLQLTLPVQCRFPLSFLVGAMALLCVVAGVALL